MQFSFAIAGDDEMTLTVPKGKLEDLIMGLRYVHETGSRLPMAYGKKPLGDSSYDKIGRMLGIDV